MRRNCALIGIPDDTGVSNVGGRIGASQGPDAFRSIFRKLKGKRNISDLCLDSGNVAGLSRDIDKNHQLARKKIAALHKDHCASLLIGGGHDHGFTQLAGVRDALGKKAKIGCINIDAHLDLRPNNPMATSGSPYYLALETGIVRGADLLEFGIQTQANDPSLWKYAKERKVRIREYSQLRESAIKEFARSIKMFSKYDAVVISLDLDAIAQGFAPGVSAPQAEGFCPAEIMAMMEISGRTKNVVSLGIFELNPIHDIGFQTARLAAVAAYRFLENRA